MCVIREPSGKVKWTSKFHLSSGVFLISKLLEFVSFLHHVVFLANIIFPPGKPHFKRDFISDTPAAFPGHRFLPTWRRSTWIKVYFPQQSDLRQTLSRSGLRLGTMQECHFSDLSDDETKKPSEKRFFFSSGIVGGVFFFWPRVR